MSRGKLRLPAIIIFYYLTTGNQSGGLKQGLGKLTQIGVLRKHDRESDCMQKTPLFNLGKIRYP